MPMSNNGDTEESDDQRAAMRMVGILVYKLGGAVDIHQHDFEALDGMMLVVQDFALDEPLHLRLVKAPAR
jgi:hypothetical protein